jgi:hypothetical protein
MLALEKKLEQTTKFQVHILYLAATLLYRLCDLIQFMSYHKIPWHDLQQSWGNNSRTMEDLYCTYMRCGMVPWEFHNVQDESTDIDSTSTSSPSRPCHHLHLHHHQCHLQLCGSDLEQPEVDEVSTAKISIGNLVIYLSSAGRMLNSTFLRLLWYSLNICHQRLLRLKAIPELENLLFVQFFFLVPTYLETTLKVYYNNNINILCIPKTYICNFFKTLIAFLGCVAKSGLPQIEKLLITLSILTFSKIPLTNLFLSSKESLLLKE